MDKMYYDKLNDEIFESIKIKTMASQFDENIIHDYYDKRDIKVIWAFCSYLFVPQKRHYEDNAGDIG